MDRSFFPPEDQLPKDRDKLRELRDAALAANLSDRYIRVIRHRIFDLIAAELMEV